MQVIAITITEYTDFGVSEDEDGGREVEILDEDATSTFAVGAALSEERAAQLIADLCRARPPTNDGADDGETVCPISHFSLSCIELGAPLRPDGAEWWDHVEEDPDPASVLRQIQAKRGIRPAKGS